MPDAFELYDPNLESPAEHAFAVAPNDGADLALVTRAVWVGGAGDISFVFKGGETVTISGIPAGTLLPYRVSRVRSTGTTATGIVGLY